MSILSLSGPARPLWTIVKSREQYGRTNLPILTVKSEFGVLLRDPEAGGRAVSENLTGYRVVAPGDLVVNRLWARFGAYGVSKEAGIISPAYWVLKISKSYDPRYLHHLLRSSVYLNEIGRISKNMPPNGFDLPWDQFRGLNIPILAIDEQQRIALFLDDQVARIETAVALRERQIKLVAERNRAAHDHFEVQTADAPAMPLIHLTRRSRPINYGVLMPGPHFPGGVPLIEAGDVMRGSITVSELRRADPEIEREYVRSRLLSGDLVMAIRGSFGAVEICPPLTEIVNVTRDAARISLDQTMVHPLYVRAVLTSSWIKSWFASRILASAVKGINIGDLRRVLIPVPDMSVQRTLAERAAEVELESDRHLRLMNGSISLLQERKRSLITAAVTGEFDVSSASTRALAGVTS